MYRICKEGVFGCDVTIKHKDNKTAYTEDFNKIVLKIQADRESLDRIKTAGDEAIGFRLRLVDGRDNHWAWGKNIEHPGVLSVNYNVKDSNNIELSLHDNLVQTFEFDIKDRENWALFTSDGGIAPPPPIHDSDHFFKFISMVIIEPGIIAPKRNDPEYDKDVFKYQRNIADSPDDLKAILYVREISFRK